MMYSARQAQTCDLHKGGEDESKLQIEVAERPVGGLIKRTADLAIATTALVLAAPIMLIVAGLIKATMEGPVFFSQARVGFQGRRFRCIKFRTMVGNAESVLAEYLKTSPEAELEWRETQKLINDPRVTRLGHVLRKSSLDELPQLFNVLLGDMSAVGPRPITSAELERYGPYVREYLAARPGLTGLWQISGRSRLGYDLRVSLDRYYVRRWSTQLDLIILLRTLPAVLCFKDSC